MTTDAQFRELSDLYFDVTSHEKLIANIDQSAREKTPLRLLTPTTDSSTLLTPDRRSKTTFHENLWASRSPLGSARGHSSVTATSRSSAQPFLGFGVVETLEHPIESTNALANRSLRIDSIYIDGPAWRVGLRMNDVIVEVEHQPVSSLEQISTIFDTLSAGQSVRVLAKRLVNGIHTSTGNSYQCIDASVLVMTTDTQYSNERFFFNTSNAQRITTASFDSSPVITSTTTTDGISTATVASTESTTVRSSSREVFSHVTGDATINQGGSRLMSSVESSIARPLASEFRAVTPPPPPTRQLQLPEHNTPSGASISMLDMQLVSPTLPTELSQTDSQRRVDIFKQFDINNNGLLSLTEVRVGCRDILRLADPGRIPRRAWGVVDIAYETARRGEFLVFNDFQRFLRLIVYFLELWIVYDQMDVQTKGVVEYAAFVEAIPQLRQFVTTDFADPQIEFKRIDAHHNGVITFSEFAEWARSIMNDPTRRR